jgi:hypothetical protein
MGLNKKRAKTILNIVFILLSFFLFLNAELKYQDQKGFGEIEYSIYSNLGQEEKQLIQFIQAYCDTIEDFVKRNPVELGDIIVCDGFYSDQNFIETDRLYNNFVKHVHSIDEIYRYEHQKARIILFIVLIILFGLYHLSVRFINKKY